MKTKIFPTILLIAAVLVSCTPTATPFPPTETSIPTSTAIPPTKRPQSLLLQDTILFSGPGNVDFDRVATLKANETVYPLALYSDFVQVAANTGGQQAIGYIHKSDINDLPENLPTLSADSVPLTPLFSPECIRGGSASSNNLLLENDGDTFDSSYSPAISIRDPLYFRIDSVSATGEFGVVELFGHFFGDKEYWKGLISMTFDSSNGQYTIRFQDGTQQAVGYELDDLGLSVSEPIQIVFQDVQGKSFQVLDGSGKLIRTIDLTKIPGLHLPDGLFPNGELYVGTSIPPHSSMKFTGLQIGTLTKGQWVPDTASYPGLAELAAAHNLTFGTEFSMQENMDARYCHATHRDFDLVFLGSLDPSGYWKGPGQYDFSQADQDLDYALRQGWKVHSSLAYGTDFAIPDWLKKGKFTRDQYIQMLEDMIKTAVGRYKGRVSGWSIANESTSRSCGPCAGGSDFWNEKIGPDYVEMAFRWAREADPGAVLILNDTNNEDPRDTQTSAVFEHMYARVKDLKSKGVPVDVVGMEMHLLLKYSSPIVPNKEAVIATMRKFADLGVKIDITEFDVDLHNHPGTPEERLQFEANLYKEMLEACLESNVCESFSTWGVSDATSWLTQPCSGSGCINEPDAAPLMFDHDYNPKPAYFAVRDVLLNFSNTSAP